MEAVTAIIKNLLKNTRVVLVLGVVLGLLLGLIIGWGLWPVQWTDGTPEVLEQTIQDDYLRMTIDSYRSLKNANPQVAADLAEDRWDYLGTAAGPTLGRVQSNPGYLDPAAVQDFRLLIESRKGAIATAPPIAEPSGLGNIVLYASILVVVILLGAGGFYLWRLLRRGSGKVTAVMQASEASKHAEKTNFEDLGLAPPITQTMTTYVLGDDLYDESFSIDTAGGEFLGEYGVGVSETVGVGEPKKVAALEVWLFDKNDIKTATKVLMSEHAYNDPNIRARLEPKGELIVAKPQGQVLLETETLQLLATVVDMEYGMGALPQNSYFERITLELAIWPRAK
ncbi:MAG: hypothetical protein C3F07_13130 [Anaerolineales bacterium]|nr:MAG: hypothetical protein C3F07_13130 [Anaerolineales bacterium]